MNENHNDSNRATTKGHSRDLLMALGVLVLAAAGYVYLGVQTHDLRRQLTTTQQDNATLRSKMSESDAQLQSALGTLRNDVAQVREDASVSLEAAQKAATRHADIVASQVAKKTAEQARQLSAELGRVKESTVDAAGKIEGINSDVGAVKTDVGAVKTDVASTKTALDETRSDLQRTRGDLGLMSGLIATNSKQIQTLRDVGDRNIYQFTLAKNGKMQKVGDVELMLRKADTGHSRFTLDVMADDKRMEKKDRGINEPVQFYTSKARQPYEIVVNEVQKNKVVGYLATPKVTISRNEQASR